MAMNTPSTDAPTAAPRATTTSVSAVSCWICWACIPALGPGPCPGPGPPPSGVPSDSSAAKPRPTIVGALMATTTAVTSGDEGEGGRKTQAEAHGRAAR